MVLIHTSIEGLDKRLKEIIPDSQIAYYAKFLLEDKKSDTVILAYNAQTPIPFKDFLFALRQKNRRVILLLNSTKSPILGYALALGIYDIAFGRISAEKIAEKVLRPAKFSDVASLFLGLKGRVSYDGNIPKKEKKQGEKETNNTKKEDETITESQEFKIVEKQKGIDVDKLKVNDSSDAIIVGLLNFLGARRLSGDMLDAVLLLEDLVVEKIIT